MTVPVAKWLGEQLAHPYRHKYCTGARDRRMDPATAPKPGGDAPGSTADGAGAGGDALAQVKGRVRVCGADGRGACGGGSAGQAPWTWDEEDFVDDGDMFEYRVLTQTGVPPCRPPTCRRQRGDLALSASLLVFNLSYRALT